MLDFELLHGVLDKLRCQMMSLIDEYFSRNSKSNKNIFIKEVR
jgi:hypothetical protein